MSQNADQNNWITAFLLWAMVPRVEKITGWSRTLGGLFGVTKVACLNIAFL